jgi:hypothetical protein
MKKNSKTIWKRLNRLEQRWLIDLECFKLKESKKEKIWYNRLSIENSKWKLTISEEKKQASWLQVAKLKERNN